MTDPIPDEDLKKAFQNLRKHELHKPPPPPPPPHHHLVHPNKHEFDDFHFPPPPVVSPPPTPMEESARAAAVEIVSMNVHHPPELRPHEYHHPMEQPPPPPKDQGHPPPAPVIVPVPDQESLNMSTSGPPPPPPPPPPIEENADDDASTVEVVLPPDNKKVTPAPAGDDFGLGVWPPPNQFKRSPPPGEESLLASGNKPGTLFMTDEQAGVGDNMTEVEGLEQKEKENKANRKKGRFPGRSWFRPMTWLGEQPESHFKVSLNLRSSWKYQAKFFAKIMVVKSIQLILINVWLLVIWLTSDLVTVMKNKHDWMYLPLGLLLVVVFLGVRLTARVKAGWHPLAIISTLAFVTIALALGLGAVTFAYGAYCVPMMTLVLLLTCLSLPFAPFMTQTSVTKPSVMRIGGVLVLVYAVAIMMVVAFTKSVEDLTHFLTLIWFPGLILAEIVLWVTLYEIRRVVQGMSFNVSERRWAFASLYV